MPPIGVPGIVICSRRDSSRVPYKPFRKVGGKALINHLIDNVKPCGYGMCLAVPREDLDDYQEVIGDHIARKINLFPGWKDDPLARMHNASQTFMIDPVIRINHDKIWVDPELIKQAMGIFKEKNLDYLYSSHLVAGSGFEIISRRVLKKAFIEFGNEDVEHISYAIKAVEPRAYNFNQFDPIYRGSERMRLLIDYEEDLELIKILYQMGARNLRSAISILGANMHLAKINRLPKTTVYTCAYNAEKYVTETMLSVLNQTAYSDCEYIIIDDCSTDGTLEKILEFPQCKNFYIKRNDKNIGLSSSSNIALDMARGENIIRIDADDCFIFPHSIETLLDYKKEKGDPDAIYPCFIDEATRAYCAGRSNHHIGGSLFKTSAVRHVKFTEKLRGYEGLDFFERAKKQLKVCYFDRKPIFFYRNTENSLSKSFLEERKEIKDRLESGITGEDLL